MQNKTTPLRRFLRDNKLPLLAALAAGVVMGIVVTVLTHDAKHLYGQPAACMVGCLIGFVYQRWKKWRIESL